MLKIPNGLEIPNSKVYIVSFLEFGILDLEFN
ncbi:hypothetical protein SAMN05216297_107187 [Flavobacterium phragmitis]|uniref:Uncharacterized protein n=1 Tax=Flavobacterium phragmitis TaxID=739143 RepID=A0A1I1S680_9FLAO|nr:hypothetical protein SAMN05216297_107187 [Flavobacterium phragmitis]